MGHTEPEMSDYVSRFARTASRTFMLEKLDFELQDATLRSLFASFRQMFYSMVVSAVIAAEAYRLSGDATFLWICAGFVAVGSIRSGLVVLFSRNSAAPYKVFSPGTWELLALVSATSFAGLTGIACGYAAAAQVDLYARILLTAGAFHYVAGLSGRVPRTEFVIWQTCASCGPMLVGLAMAGGFADFVMFGITLLNFVMAFRNSLSLAGTMAERHNAEKRIARQARYDELTGLLNRHGFKEQIEVSLRSETALAGRGALLAIDLDDFKDVNDTFGHAAGDDLLREVGRRIAAIARPNDFPARIAGDEFHLVLADVDAEEAHAIADRLLAALRDTYHFGSFKGTRTASIGLAMMTPDIDVDEIMVAADVALYTSKRDGKGRLTAFTAEIKAAFDDRKALEIDFAEALRKDAIAIAYQPIVAPDTGLIVACEALLRWNHPVRGFVNPALFVEVAERMGLIHELGRKTLRKACLEASAWPSHVKLAVNVSPVQFERPDFLVLSVTSALMESGLVPDRLELEITESALMNKDAQTKDTIRTLLKGGVRLSLDDFGEGYSNLGYITSFDFRKVKIDQKFSRDLMENPKSFAVVKAMRGLTRDLGMELVVEGIETPAQVELIKGLGVDQIQGWHYSKAVPPREIAAMLAAQPFATASEEPARKVAGAA